MAEIKYKLTYYDVMGRAEGLRLMFKVAQVPFEDVRLPHPGPQSFGVLPEEIKKKLPYGQVPVLEFDGKMLSQTLGIGRYLARKFNFYGADDFEASQVDEILEAMTDFSDNLKALFFAKSEEERAGAIKNLETVAMPKYLGKFDQLVAGNPSGFLIGKSITLADFQLYSSLSSLGPYLKIDFTKNYVNLQNLFKKIENIPQVKQWIEIRPKSYM